MSRREKNRIEKCNRIIAAALKVFAEVGYLGASMERIARQAGLTKPTLYNYYPSKDILFEEMMKIPGDTMMLNIEAPDKNDISTQLLEFAWAYTEIVMHQHYLALARLIISEAQRFPEIGRKYQESGPNKVLVGLIAFMDASKTLGKLTFEDVELAAEDFWGLILSAPRNRALHSPDLRLKKSELARFVHNGLRVFFKAYSTNPQHDLKLLEIAIEHRNYNEI